ncbi:MAG: phosphatase PAP2 family protein [Desulfovibrionales bacterium]
MNPGALFAQGKNVLRWLLHQELSIFLVLFCLVAGVWAFIELADEVKEKEVESFDSMILERVRGVDPSGQPRGPLWLAEATRDITALGGYTVLSLVSVVAAIFLRLKGKTTLMFFTLGAAFGGILLSSLLKILFSRERPDVALRLVAEQSYSFPSGHAMMSAVVYLSIAVLVSATQPRLRERVFLITSAFFLTFIVGVSRMYLGVHYPTDVLAGWSVGLAWASLWWFAGLFLRQRGKT